MIGREMSNEEFVNRLAEFGFISPVPDDAYVFDPVANRMEWSNDLNRMLWHGTPLRRFQGLNVVGLLAETGRGPRKTPRSENAMSTEDAQKMMAEMRLRRLRELEDWE